MPTYSYECQQCSHVMAVFHSMSASPEVTCEECGCTHMKRLIGTGAGVIFKGSGFYETDYKRSGAQSGKPSSDGGAQGESKSAGTSQGTSEKKGDSGASSGSKPGSGATAAA